MEYLGWYHHVLLLLYKPSIPLPGFPVIPLPLNTIPGRSSCPPSFSKITLLLLFVLPFASALNFYFYTLETCQEDNDNISVVVQFRTEICAHPQQIFHQCEDIQNIKRSETPGLFGDCR